MSEVRTKGQAAKKASYHLSNVESDEKNKALRLIAEQLIYDQDSILEENKKDMSSGQEEGFTDALLDRMFLNKERLHQMADAIHLLTELKDPIGEVLETIEKDNGLRIEKKRVPLGVIGLIYEARPNVTVDAATLSLKTGNAVVLRGSSSAKHSNRALVASIHRALEKSTVPVEAVQLIEDTSRETAKELFTLTDYLDVLIPRGGKNLIQTVIREATVPVIETGAGTCHLFIEASANPQMAEQIALNAKTQRPSVCNSIETILIQDTWFDQHGLAFLNTLHKNNVSIVADAKICDAFPLATLATEEDWYEEYLGLKVSVKLVHTTVEAIAHINIYGTHHSESIVTEDTKQAEMFLRNVDATSVYHNASTRFTDGFEFGYGAEMGISTQKLHVRGPMGLNALTSTKFVIHGNGQIRRS